MKYLKTFNVVMLTTKKASELGLYNNKLCLSSFGHVTDSWINLHLYVTTTDNIKVGDRCICIGDIDYSDADDDNTQKIIEYTGVELGVAKIVASNNKIQTPNFELPLQFVQAYIKAYNNSFHRITEISLEVDVAGDVKTRPDGTVIVHQSKTYTQTEVDEMLDRQACITTQQVLNTLAKMYSGSEAEALVNKAWHNGYWTKHEEVNGEGSSSENPKSILNFIKDNLVKISQPEE